MIALTIGEPEAAMSWMEFLSSLVGSLAWPVAAVIIACLFRSQISGLLDKVRTITWGDKIVDFGQKLDEIENASSEGPPPEKAERTSDDRFDRLLAISPAAAVIDAWNTVEAILFHIADARGYDIAPPRRTMEVIRAMERDGVISEPTAHTLHELRSLRNAAAHHGMVKPADAFRFKELTEHVIAGLHT